MCGYVVVGKKLEFQVHLIADPVVESNLSSYNIYVYMSLEVWIGTGCSLYCKVWICMYDGGRFECEENVEKPTKGKSR